MPGQLYYLSYAHPYGSGLHALSRSLRRHSGWLIARRNIMEMDALRSEPDLGQTLSEIQGL